MSEASTAGWLTGYDAVNYENMPGDGEHYLYIDAEFAAPAAAHEAYPHAMTIAVDLTPADEYDVENGNPDHPVTWCIMMRQDHGYIGRIYCNEATVGKVLDQFTTAGIAPPRFRIATWTGTPPKTVTEYGSGTDAIQYATNPGFDTNLIRPGLPRYTRPAPTPPQPPATPPPTRKDDMKNHCSILRILNQTEVFVINWSAGKLWHVGDTPSLQDYLDAGVEQLTIEQDELATLQTKFG